MDGKNVRRGIFLVFFLALFLLVARLFYPFMTILLWSALLYILLLPLFNRATREGSERPLRGFGRNLIAGSFSLLGVLLLVVPLAFLAFNMVRQVGDLAGEALTALENHPEILDLSPNGRLGGFIYRLSDGTLDLSSVNLRGEIYRFIAGSSGKMIGLSGALIKNAATFLIALAFIVFTLYFFLVDGGHLLSILVDSIPIEHAYTRLFMRTLRDMSKQLVVGYFLVALYQATAAFLLFSIFHVKGALVLAALTAVSSFLPMVGASLVWLPVSLARILSGDLTGGIALLLLSGIFISTLDNFIRPILLRDRLKIHPLLIFFSILGGLEIFGFNGLILGPLILILFFTAAKLYDKVYDRKGEEEEEKELAEEGKEGGGAAKG
jgi:predicted PurR-regulated permease PerM